MNKTTEALKLAEEALLVWRENNGLNQRVNKALAAIREALAEQIPEWVDVDDYEAPSVSDGVCGGCAKKSADGWALYCVECWEKAEPVSNERLLEAAGYIKKAEPVKQEPVAYRYDQTHIFLQNVKPCFRTAEDRVIDGPESWVEVPLYAAPVDAKAIRAEALEEAAKVCEVKLTEHDNDVSGIYDMAIKDCAAAIRGLK